MDTLKQLLIDLHLETATVRESLRFSAMLRQPKAVSNMEKYNYVEDVIDMLNMRDFADAVVGVPSQGLNVEQRKLLTIGVELAAKPKLLLFLDEPTSGLDSQSSWAICAFLRKLADAGQAILCTVHQVCNVHLSSSTLLTTIAFCYFVPAV
jgi:ABC-type multidrug transport system ATPase subunit